MKVLITGFPGMGKSAIAAELKRRGHKAYDPEKIRNMMHVEDRKSGKYIQPPNDIPAGWYDNVGAFRWSDQKIRKLLDTPDDIFICSKAHNQDSYYSLFDDIFILTLDNTELIQRLANREGRTIGKSNSELSDILKLHERFEQSLINHGAFKINVHKSIQAVVDEILTKLNFIS